MRSRSIWKRHTERHRRVSEATKRQEEEKREGAKGQMRERDEKEKEHVAEKLADCQKD